MAIAMSRDWDAGYRLLCDEQGWPLAAIAVHEEIAEELAGNFDRRRMAMR